jgi:hypothetical protein
MSPSSDPNASSASSKSDKSVSLGLYGAKPYESDGGFSAQGLLLTTGAGVGVAVALGVLAAIVGQYFYAILIFPLAIGAAVGGVQAWAIKHTKIRTPIACGVAGLVAGIVAVTTMHYVDFLTFRQAMGDNSADEEALRQAIAQAEDDQERALLNEFLAQWEADSEIAQAEQVDSFVSYLDWSARQGVEITSTRGNSKPMNLGYTGSYIYWGIEALIVALVSATMARSRASEPFCVACDTWKVQRELGSVHASVKAVGIVIESGRLSDLADVAESRREEAAISVYECPFCPGEGEVVLQVDAVSYNNGNRVKSQQARAVYPRQAAEEIARLFESCEEMPLCDDIDPQTLRQLKAAAEGRDLGPPAADVRDAGELVAAKR